MNGRNLVTPRKLRLMLLGLVVFLVVRQESWAAHLNANYSLVLINQYPLWRTIIEYNPPPAASSLIQPKEYRVNNETLAQEQGLLLFAERQEAKAITLWQVAGLNPGEVMLIQAHYALAMNDPQIAIGWYEQAVELDPLLATGWQALGKLYAQKEQLISAMAAYERAVELGNVGSVDPLAKLWRDKGNHVAAIAIWQTALDRFPDTSERLQWWQGLSNSLRATEQWEIGTKVVENGLNEFPEDARLYTEKGAIIYGRYADASAAMDAINTAITLDSTMVSAYSTAANIMAEEKRYEAAYGWYTEAIGLNPGNASFYVASGHMARAAGNLQLALEAFEDTIDRFPGFSSAYFGIARVYKQLDDRENAVIAIDQGLQLIEANDVQDYLQAGEIYQWSGRLDEAVAVYQQVLTIDSENVRAKRALQQLQNK